MSYLDNLLLFFGSCFDVLAANEIGIMFIGMCLLMCVILAFRRFVRW